MEETIRRLLHDNIIVTDKSFKRKRTSTILHYIYIYFCLFYFKS